MRMEELSDSRYEKGTDSVEKYLLNIVQNYFKNQNVSSLQSRETIIKKAVARMKEEVDFESIGVLSITLPDGEKRIGAVQISLEDLGGEPRIADKKTAFNVNFGNDAGTACEGNDPRLSDSREPLPHQHSIADILNLDAEILALHGKIDRLVFHEHENSDALNVLRYTGTKSAVDLADVEKLQASINSLLSDMQSIADSYKDETRTAVSGAQEAIQDAQVAFNSMKSTLDAQSEQYKLELKTELDEKIADALNQIDAKFDDYATGASMAGIQGVINNAITMYGSTAVYMADVVAAGGTYKVEDGIPVEIQSFGPHMEPIIDAYMIIDGLKVKLPYLIFNDDLNMLDGAVSITYDGQNVYVHCNCKNTPPEAVKNALVQVMYSVKGV